MIDMGELKVPKAPRPVVEDMVGITDSVLSKMPILPGVALCCRPRPAGRQ
jgi:hypothetical protein